jgi:PAS domain S-box-containing protein
MVKQRGLDLPFIIVSGHIDDATAVAAMKGGAHDYIMKDKLARLAPAVERELREAESRRERRRSEDRLKVESAFRRAIENSVPSGISAVDLDGRQTYVNPAFCAMVGWSQSELVGAHPPFQYWPSEETEIITGALSKVIAGNAPHGGLELNFRRRSGERFQVLLQVTPLRDSFGNLTGWVSSASDITERKRAEIRLAAEHAITRILANAQSLNEAAPGIVQVLLDSLEVDYGALYTVDPRHQVLMPMVTTLRTASPQLKPFLEESRRLSFSRGEYLPGRVWETRRAFWVPDLSQETALRRRAQAMHVGLRSVIAFPLQSGPDFFGVLEFFSVAVMEQDLTLLNMMTAIGSEIGQFIQRRSAEDALRRAYDELEIRVQQRTAELKQANTKLQSSIAERKRLENELLEITERERRRIGLDLHDDLGQKLSGIALMTKGLELKLAKTHAKEAQDAARIHGLVHEAMNHASDLAHDLATLDLKQDDLPAALEGLSEHAKELFGISCKFKSEGKPPSLDPNVAKQLYKIAQEGVTNAIKHGKAKRVSISLSAAERLTLTVQNDGVPFPDLHGQSPGMGLRIMSYRASLIGGFLQVKANGSKGTLLTCSLPLTAKTEDARQTAV